MFERIHAYIQSSAILKTAIGSFGLKLVAAGGGFASGILLARLLGPKEFGVYSLIMAVVNLAAIVASLGLPGLVTREVAKYSACEQWTLLKGLIRTSHQWVLLITTLLIIGGAALRGWEWVFTELPLATVFLALLLIPLIAFNQLRASILRGLHWVLIADIPELLLRPTLMLLLVGAVYIFYGQADAGYAVALQFMAALAAFAIGSWFLYSRIPNSVKLVATETKSHRWSKEAHPFFWIAIIGIMESQLGIYFLGYLSGPEQVGLYQAAVQLVSLVILGLMAVNLPLQPQLAAAWARNDSAQVQRLVSDATKLGTVVALASAAILIPFAELITNLYGEQYQDAANVLRILVLSQLFNAMAGPCGLVLASAGKQRYALYTIVLALVINAIANVLLVPRFGAVGTAVSALLGILVWNTLQVFISWKYINIMTPIFSIEKNRAEIR